MRFVFVPFVVLASFTLATAQAPKFDRTKQPPTTSVNALNFPETQTDDGAVSVHILPTVLTVGGTVNVGNLPLDSEGAVRVASAPARQPVMFELLTAPIVVPPLGSVTVALPNTPNTNGYSDFGIFVTRPANSDCFGGITFTVKNRWSPDEEFSNVYDYRGGGFSSGTNADRERTLHRTLGGEMQVVMDFHGGNCEALYPSVRLYLFP